VVNLALVYSSSKPVLICALCSVAGDSLCSILYRPSAVLRDSLLWPSCVADAYITFSSCFFLLSFFLAYSQRLQIGCLPYFYTWCGPSANLECRSEMCCMRLAGKAGPKNSPSGHHRTTLSGYIFATKALIDNR